MYRCYKAVSFLDFKPSPHLCIAFYIARQVTGQYLKTYGNICSEMKKMIEFSYKVTHYKIFLANTLITLSLNAFKPLLVNSW